MGFSSQSTPMISNPYKDLPEPILPIVQAWKNCQDCDLHKGKCNYVYYRGSAPCDILFIGEAPGHDEDLCGLPFVGRSGKVLETMISTIKTDYGLNFTYGITNIVACIPLENGKTRIPSKVEADACKFRLLTTIQQASPRYLCVLGKTAKKYLRIPARGMEREHNLPVLELQEPEKILRKGGYNSLEYRRNLLYLREVVETLHDCKETI